jgi:glutaredoxin
MSEQAEKFLAEWEIEHAKIVARSDREAQASLFLREQLRRRTSPMVFLEVAERLAISVGHDEAR